MSIERPISRRELLGRSCNGLGALALAGILSDELSAASGQASPMAVRPQHLTRKAKHCIFLFMAGGASQVDTFDYKPALSRIAGKRLPKFPGLSGQIAAYLDAGNVAMPSPFEFRRYGQCGRYISTLFPNIAGSVDDLAFLYGIEVESNNHAPATMHVNTGTQFPGAASVGAWITYGLGSPNQNLPGYVVIHDRRGAPQNGSAVWSNGFLPTAYQGTVFRPSGTPILHLRPPKELDRGRQRKEFDLVKWLNERHLEERADEAELEARIHAYELAFRMQTEATEAVDLSKESETTRRMYGLGNSVSEDFGRQCLLARRLVEKGVRHVLLVHGVDNGKYSWDDHGNIKERMPRHAAEVDQPIGALLRDLKQRGLLDETLVVWASEMGRTPMFVTEMNDVNPATPGRDHNQYGLVMWLAGGDVKGGSSVGQTDEFGLKAAEQSIHVRDVHATILNLLGMSDERLTYLHAGRFRKLTDIGGQVLTNIIA
jgi:hypothetical protein